MIEKDRLAQVIKDAIADQPTPWMNYDNDDTATKSHCEKERGRDCWAWDEEDEHEHEERRGIGTDGLIDCTTIAEAVIKAMEEAA